MCVCVCVCVSKNHPGIMGSTANAKNNTKFIPDTQAKEATVDRALSFLATMAKRVIESCLEDSPQTPVPGALGVRGYGVSARAGVGASHLVSPGSLAQRTRLKLPYYRPSHGNSCISCQT